MWGSELTIKAATPYGASLEVVPSLCVVGIGPAFGGARVSVHKALDRGAKAVARGGARCASQVLDYGAQAAARGSAQVLERGPQAVAHGNARCASQVINRGAQANAHGAA